MYKTICFILLIMFGPVTHGASADDDKFVLATFEQYQQQWFISEIAYPCDIQLVSHRGPRAIELAFEKLDGAAAWLVGSRSGKELTAEQSVRLKQWIADGGILILAAREGSAFFPVGKDIEWTGRSDWRPVKTGVTEKLKIKKHPLTRGVAKQTNPLDNIEDLMMDGFSADGPPIPELVASSQWGLKDRGTGTPLITNQHAPLLWTHQHGKGHIVYLGADFTPLASKPDIKQNHIAHVMSRPGILIWQNLVKHFKLPTRSARVAKWAEQTGKDAALWWRHETELTAGGAMANPSHPLEGEEFDELKLELLKGERDWQQVFFTTATARKQFAISIDNWTGPDTTIFTAKHIDFYWQRPHAVLHPLMVEQKPLPNYHKAPFHMMPATELPPLEKDVVSLPDMATHTFWLNVRCPQGTSPGQYEGTIRLRDGSRLVAELPLQINVRPIDMPQPHYLSFEYEHNWNTLPGGSLFKGKDDRRLLQRCIQQTTNMGIDTGMVYGYIHGVYGANHVVFRDSGESLVDKMRANPAFLQSEQLPALDFSYYDDFYFTPAIMAGQTRFQTNTLFMKDFLLVALQQLDETIEARSPEHTRLYAWYHGEFARYVKERGYPEVWCKTGDELVGEEALQLYEPLAVLKRAGYRPMTTSPSFQFSQVVAKQLNPVLDLWMAEMYVQPWHKLAKEHLNMDVGNDVYWPYNASSIPGFTCDSGRRFGWAVAYARHTGFHFHHYFRYYWTDQQPALAGPNGLYQGPASVSYAQGIKYGRILALLLHLLDEAQADPAKQPLVKKIRSELDKIIGPGDGAILKIEHKESRLTAKQGVRGVNIMNPYAMSPNARDHEHAKVAVIDLIQQLLNAYPQIKYNVAYGDHQFVSKGIAHFKTNDSDAWAALHKYLGRYTSRSSDAAPITLLAGTNTSADITTFVEDNSLTDRINNRYPAAGHYAIMTGKAKDKPVIAVIGGDNAGVTQGVASLIQFLQVETIW